MKKFKTLLILLFLSLELFAQSGKVYNVLIKDMIDLGLAPYVKRAIEEAEADKADAIIFTVNTFGGRVDAATQIKDVILDSKVKTIAFIDKRAISAGALISLSCEQIVMVPGASIGATTVVDQGGAKVSEKYQSYMRSEMRSTAERNGRRTDVAEAMVDERVVVEGLVDSTQLVTLTSAEAVQWGIADTVLSSLDEVLKYNGIENAEIIILEENWAETFVRFIQNPVITSLLMMIGLVGLWTEIKTPGWGLPGTAAIIALALFFGTGMILELASTLEIALFVIGVVLLLLEIFVIPGFGIAGVGGIILIVAGLFLGLISDFPLVTGDMISDALIQMAGALALAIIMVIALSKILPKSTAFSKLILNSGISSTSGYSSYTTLDHLEGEIGKTFTVLRPSGTALLKNKRFDVVTEGEYIEKGVKVIVTKISGSKVVVEKYTGSK